MQNTYYFSQGMSSMLYEIYHPLYHVIRNKKCLLISDYNNLPYTRGVIKTQTHIYDEAFMQKKCFLGLALLS